jgi:hypothetical protein
LEKFAKAYEIEGEVAPLEVDGIRRYLVDIVAL